MNEITRTYSYCLDDKSLFQIQNAMRIADDLRFKFNQHDILKEEILILKTD